MKKKTKVIYRKYLTKSTLNRLKNRRFKEFVLELLRLHKSGTKTITTDDLYFYIRRHTSKIATKKVWKSTPRTHYFKFWIKMLEGMDVIKQDLNGFGWIINDPIHWKYNFEVKN